MGVYHAHIDDEFNLGAAAYQITQLGGRVTEVMASDLEAAKVAFEGNDTVRDYIRNLPCVKKLVPQENQ
jgi:hypothetical protein